MKWLMISRKRTEDQINIFKSVFKYIATWIRRCRLMDLDIQLLLLSYVIFFSCYRESFPCKFSSVPVHHLIQKSLMKLSPESLLGRWWYLSSQTSPSSGGYKHEFWIRLLLCVRNCKYNLSHISQCEFNSAYGGGSRTFLHFFENGVC